MSWLKHQTRLAQVYTFTVAALNDCGILPDGAEIKPWIRAEFGSLDPVPSKFEVDMVLSGMLSEGVKFRGTPESAKLFSEHPLFEGQSLMRAK